MQLVHVRAVVIPQRFQNAASVLKETSGEGLPVIDTAHITKKTVSHQKQ
jgi:hypothetical protein